MKTIKSYFKLVFFPDMLPTKLAYMRSEAYSPSPFTITEML